MRTGFGSCSTLGTKTCPGWNQLTWNELTWNESTFLASSLGWIASGIRLNGIGWIASGIRSSGIVRNDGRFPVHRGNRHLFGHPLGHPLGLHHRDPSPARPHRR